MSPVVCDVGHFTSLPLSFVWKGEDGNLMKRFSNIVCRFHNLSFSFIFKIKTNMLNCFKIIMVLNTAMCYIWDNNTWKTNCVLNFVARLINFGVDLRKLLPISSTFNSTILHCGKGGPHRIAEGCFDKTNKQQPQIQFFYRGLKYHTTIWRTTALLLSFPF